MKQNGTDKVNKFTILKMEIDNLIQKIYFRITKDQE